ALFLHIVPVASAVAADQFAAQRGVDAVRPGVATPPAEDLAQNAHAVRLARSQRAPRTCPHMAPPGRACPCTAAAAELPQPTKSGIALACGSPRRARFAAIRAPCARAPRTPKGAPLLELRGLSPQVLFKRTVATTSST